MPTARSSACDEEPRITAILPPEEARSTGGAASRTRSASGRARPEPRHMVQFHDDDEAFSEVVGEFMTEGLRANEPVLLITTGAHREALRRWPGGGELDVAERDGRLITLDAEEMLTKLFDGGWPSGELFERHVVTVIERLAGASAHGHVRVHGEIVDLLWQAGQSDAALRLEELWNDILERHPISLLCSYSARHFDGEVDLRRICTAHDHVVTADRDRRRRSVVLDGAYVLPHQLRVLVAEIAQRKEIERELRATVQELSVTQEELEASVERERTARREAEAASRAKDEFLAMLGHELRNPLAPILTAAQILDQKLGDAAAKELTVITRQVRHLARLVDDLLDVSRIARGNIEVKREPIELGPVVMKAIEMASPLLEQRQHRLVADVPVAGLVVDGDDRRLAQAVSNLLTNAARYSEPGGLIEVVALREEDTVVLSVRDRGMGVAPELLPKLFDTFFRGPAPGARDDGGLGLGLAIVKGVATLHGGTVEARSEGIGRGSEFVIRLPASRRACSEDADSAPAWRADAACKGRRVLVVDDNADAAEMLAELLTNMGYETRVAADGLEALDIAADFRPEAALLDIGMPVMDGYELAGRLRTSTSLAGVRLVAITGYGQPADQQRARSAGFDAHVTKPVDLADITDLLARLLEG